MKRLVWDSDVKNIRDEKIRGLRPDIKDEWDLIDAVPTADLGELWTPVDRGLPEEGWSVLLLCKNGAMFVGRRTRAYAAKGETRWCVGTPLGSTKMLNKGRVTHWMPLPDKPKEECEDDDD